VFQIVALPFDALKDLPPLEFKTLTALLRYVDRLGRCWPSLRQLAADIGMSEATACRAMKRLADYGVFDERARPGNGRYRYRIAARFLPRWPGKQPRKSSDCTAVQDGLTQQAGHQANPAKQVRETLTRPRFASSKGSQDELPDLTDQWKARISSWVRSGGRFWLPQWGEKPGQPGCMVPTSVLLAISKAG
jgi:DNA-binding transcriptional MocR family regulator